MTEVFIAGVSGLDRNTPAPYISQYRREKLVKLRDDRAYRHSLGAELLLVRAVELTRPDVALPLDIICGEHGRPELRAGELCFNLSHSGQMAACAVSDAPVGIDIQRPSIFNDALARRFFSKDEYLFLLGAPDTDMAFTKLWCIKESYLKWLGVGLDRALNSFTVVFRDGGAFISGDARCSITQYDLGDYSLAVCASSSDSRIRMREIELP